MESEIELKLANDEVLRKIGRNMLLYQQVEHMLKFLIAEGNFSGYVSEVMANKEKQAMTVHKQTMGQLVGQYPKNIRSDAEDSAEDRVDRKEAFISIGFNVETDADHYELKKQALVSIVDDRNELIHHLLPRFNPNSIESCVAIQEDLDQQREKLLPELEELEEMIKALQEGRKELGKIFMSEDFWKQFELSMLMQSQLIKLLIEMANQAERSDGWVMLNTAGQLIRQYAHEEWLALSKRYGQKTLKGLILASELFDIKEEPTDKGGIRVFYRLKPD